MRPRPRGALTTDSEHAFHGQFGEDHLLAEIFGDRAAGYCVEVGAHDGRTGSASYLFEQKGWRCLLIEPIPALVEEIRRHRECLVVNAAASSSEGHATFFVAHEVEPLSTLDLTPERLGWIERAGGHVEEITVRTATLDSLLADAGFPEIQFITIDVEGHERSVLEGLTLETYKPRVVIIEDNSIAGDRGVSDYMAERGYVHFHRTGVNEWYARRSDAELVVPARIRSFERAKTRERRKRRRQHAANRIAAEVGRHLPAGSKRRLRRLYESMRPKR
jgi:FkbM family methyltransferase